jgi:hypothetical protein
MDDGHPPPRYHNDFDFDFPPDKFSETETLKLGASC